METKQYAARLLKFDENNGVSKQVFDEFFNEDIGLPFKERLTNNLIRGEYGPPLISERMSMSERIHRQGYINDLSVALAVVSVDIREDAIYGIIQPTGPMGQAMVEHLDNHVDDVVILAMRFFGRTEPSPTGEGVRWSKIQRIIGFDLTNEFVDESGDE